MNILLAADIFGNCPTFQRIITELSNTASVVSVTPYQNQVKQFASEDEAYDAFLSAGGMEEYIKRIHVISEQQQFDVLIGFSAGGAAIWAAQTYFKHVQHAIAFYPGQLRHYLDVTPNTNWSLIFANHEKHFDQATIIEKVIQYQSVAACRSPFEHGFINCASNAFNQQASDHFIAMLKDAKLVQNVDLFRSKMAISI